MKAGFILGIIGGIFGLLGGLFAILFGAVFDNVGEQSSIATQGWAAVAASVVAIFVSTQIKSHPKRSGWLLIACGITGLVSISFFYILPAVLLVIGGISVLRKSKVSRV